MYYIIIVVLLGSNFGHLMRRVWLIGKDSDAGRDWGQEEKGTTEDETAGWHHWFDGRETEWIPGVGNGQRGLACCDSWGLKELDTTEGLNWTERKSTLNWLTDAEAEAPKLQPPDAKSWLIGKDPDAGKDWGQEEKRETEDKVIGWHHLLNGPKCEQTLGDSEGQGGLACCSSCSCKELDTT